MKTRIKKSKWILVSILSLMLVLTNVIVIAAATDGEVYSGVCGTNLTWELDSDTGVLHIEGNGTMSTYDSGYAPWYGYRTIIKEIVVEDTVSSISKNAFYGCSNVKEMVLPYVGESRTATGSNGTLGYIGNISAISKITITDAVSIPDNAFSNKAITEIILNDEIESIGASAFYNCIYLDIISLPNNLKSIGTGAFRNCDALEVLDIPSDVTSIPASLFYDCDKLTNIKLHSDISIISSSAFYSCDSLKAVNLPENLQTIGEATFKDCIALESITIPDKVTAVGKEAFSGCSNAKSLVLGNGITSIETSTFSGCTNLTNVHIGKSVETIASLAFSNLTNLQSLTIPNNVLSIEAGAFKGCSSLTEISVPFVGESRTATGPNATFGYIFGYTTVHQHVDNASSGFADHSIFEGVSDKYLGKIVVSTNAAYGYRFSPTNANYQGLGWDTSGGFCWSSKKDFIDYKVGVNTSFFDQYGNTNVFKAPANTVWQYSCNDFAQSFNEYILQSYYYYIPTSISKVTVTDATNIGTAAFMNCSNITEINIESSVSQIGDYAFRNFGVTSNSTENFVVSGDILLAYKGAETSVIIPESIRIIAPRAFYENNKILSVQLSSKTEYVGANAFYNCKKATVHVPRMSDKLTVGTDAFTGTGSVSYLNSFSYTNGNDTFYYTVDENGNAIIIDCKTTSEQITLPVSLDGYTVTAVGYKSFADCTTLKNVTIPNNIIKIDAYAFYGCTGLVSVTIPATCVYVGEYAFANCNMLTAVTISEGVTHIGDNCFENCISLTKIVVPDSCTYLGKYAFYNCTSLESATIGISVPSIEKYTFYNCEKLKTVVIGIKVERIDEYAFYNTALERVATPNALKTIGKYAFAENKALTRVSFKSGIQSIADGAFCGDSLLATINLPTTLETIGAYAFYDCKALTSVTIPELVTAINDYACANCTALTTVKVNAETVIIGDKAFAYCTSLNSFTTEGTITSVGEKAFYRNILTTFDFKNSVEYIGADAFAFNLLTDISLPDTVVYIGNQAFANCSTLATISIPDSVAYVGAYAFFGNANNLTITIRYNSGRVADYLLYNTDVYKVIMEDGITEIGKYAFALCHDLAEITFTNTLQTIGDYAFYDNRDYTELTLPNTLLSIGQYAFARGYQFVQINIPDSVQAIGEYAFYREEAGNHIDPKFTVKFYHNDGVIAEGILDGQHIQHIILDDNIHTVGNNAFSNCVNLVDILLPDTISSFGTDCFLNDNSIILNVKEVDGLVDDSIYREKLSGVGTVNVKNTNVGEYAFYGNSSLIAVNISGEVQIGDYAFAENTQLQDVNIVGKTDIGDYAFSNDINLLKANIAGNSDIGNYSFYNCNSMTDFVIDGTIERIGEHAFDSCKALKAMILPSTVNYIGSHAFYDCNSMTSINIPDGVEKVLSHTFYGCASLGSIEVPNSVIAIEDYAFYGCVVAESITLSNQCKTIGDYAFYNCKALTELTIPNSVTSIGEYAFRSCGGITELVFSDNVDEIGACAFYDCNGLKTVKLGKKIIELGDRMFYGCVNLESLYIYAPLSYIDELAFYGADFATVYCGRDDYMINFFDENGIFYEILDDLVYQYKITFVTDNGEIISSGTYDSGSTITAPTNPTKTADKTYTYVFAGWDQEVTVVGGNKTYTASFTPVYIEYTVEFNDQNGNTLSTKTYHYGDEVTAPSNPTKAADNTYTYAFAGWNKEVVACEGDATYTATYTPTYIEYTVEFKDFGGETISSNTYHYGDAIVVPANPTRAADLLGTYSFKGWDKAIVACAGNATYTATYDITYIDYTVTFKNYDGSTISTKTYHYGDTVTVPTTPIKAADETYTYVFAGWNNTVTVCEGNAEYVATFTPKYIEYTVVFKNYDDTVISTKAYHYGQSVTAPTNPTKPSDVRYSYTFAGWDTPVTACAGNATYKATYSSEYIDYTITFVDYNGTVLGTKTYHYGETIEAIADPTKAADNTYTYAFAGWDKALGTCEGTETFTATYTPTYIEYKVVFKNHDGTTITEANYHYGATVVEPSTIPTKLSDNTCTYTFNGWDKSITTCKGDTVYTATFTPVYINYTITFKNDNGSILSTQTYHYGETITQPTTPTKASDKVYSYSFKAWDKAVIKCEGDATYTATYTPTYIEYTVKFVDEDNTPISTRTYHYGDTIVAPTTPTKASDNTYNYTFAGWDKAVTNCDGDATYKATYTSAYINYTVVFKNYNDDVISSKTYHYGDAVVVPGTPKKPSDANYCYVFVGWDKSVTNCYGDSVYTAKFTASDLPITTVNNSSARANETVVVNILLSGAPNLGSLAISDISYNTSAFELLSVDWKVADAILSNWDAATGKGALVLSTAKDVNGTIISLTFKVKDGTADGNYPVSCTVTSQECDFKNVAGQITVYSVAPGDVDGNESVDKDDAIYLLMHSFFPEDYPINQEADYNGNGMVDKDDAIHLLMYTFFPDDYPLAPAPAAVTITTTEERKKEDEE